MPNSHQISAKLLDRHLAGECSSDESIHVNALLGENPVVAALATDVYAQHPDPDELWAEFGARKAGKRIATPKPHPQRAGVPGFRSRWAIVTGVIIAMVVAIAVPNLWNESGTQTNPNSTREYVTQRSQFATMELPDGSQVRLAPESQIMYQENKAGKRTVTLVGQASFTVVHASQYPFVVTTGLVTTQVLGTTFDVRWYPDDQDIQISVETGRVAVNAVQESLIVNPGQVATVSDSSASVLDREDAVNLASLRNGRLVFTNTSVQALLKTLGRWYGYEFRLADSSLAMRQISTVLDINKPGETLRMIGSLLDVSMAIKGDTVILAGRDAAESAVPTRQPGSKQAIYTGMEVGK